MTTSNPTPAPTLTQVFAELYRHRNRRGQAGKLTPEQVAENLGTTDIATVTAHMQTVFFAELLHMAHYKVKPTDTRCTWHYGITRRARQIVTALGLDGVTDDVIRTDYANAMAWRPRKDWAATPATA